MKDRIVLPLQSTSIDTWHQKYQLKDVNGVALEADPSAAKDRVARAMAVQEKRQYRKHWEKEFRDMLEFCTPGGRINSNAGVGEHRQKVSLINCTVSDTIEDSMDSILSKLYESGITLKSGCGIGYEFSTLRPKGAHVFGAGASTSGPLSFMDIYDAMCNTISSAGGRRGAQMGTFDIGHPDVMDYIKAKREDGRLRKFNLSLLVTDKFLDALKNDQLWVFEWNGKPHGNPIRAVELWDTVMKSNYDFAEPGIILVDRINRFNNLWFCENIRATNPCGEQPLPPYGSCLLGSVLLTQFVKNPFQHNASFDFDLMHRWVKVFSRFLDNVVNVSGLPLPQQEAEIMSKRRHGMGIIGLGSAMTMLNMTYGDAASVQFTEQVNRMIALTGFETGAELAKEKGEAPVLRARYNSSAVNERPGNVNQNWQRMSSRKSQYSGRELMLMSHYFDRWHDDSDAAKILKMVEKNGSRYTHHSSIAPTGTISLTFGNNASNGIEPSFSHYYIRNKIKEGSAAKEAVPVYSYEFLMYKHLVEAGKIKHINAPEVRAKFLQQGKDENTLDPNHMPPRFSVADSVSPEQHIAVQEAAQLWVDSSISKTINVPTDITFDAFKNIYKTAYEAHLKGCTTFRFNPEVFQGVLVREDDLKNTMYTFTTEDGKTVEVSGDTMIQYQDGTYTAANLFDAHKENYFGKL